MTLEMFILNYRKMVEVELKKSLKRGNKPFNDVEWQMRAILARNAVDCLWELTAQDLAEMAMENRFPRMVNIEDVIAELTEAYNWYSDPVDSLRELRQDIKDHFN